MSQRAQAAGTTINVGPVYVRNDQDLDQLAYKIKRSEQERRK
jgi:hypothetical protein